MNFKIGDTVKVVLEHVGRSYDAIIIDIDDTELESNPYRIEVIKRHFIGEEGCRVKGTFPCKKSEMTLLFEQCIEDGEINYK